MSNPTEQHDDDGPRLDLVAHLRDQIKAGTYVTSGKLRAAAMGLSRELDTGSDGG